MVRDLSQRAGARPVAGLVDADPDAAGFGDQRAVGGVAQVSAERVRLVVRGVHGDGTHRQIAGVGVLADRAAGQLLEFGEIGFDDAIAARLRDDGDVQSALDALNAYINGFSKNVREIMERFAFDQQIARMAEKNLLYEVAKAFCDPKIDLTFPGLTPAQANVQMGYVFEELIRIGAEQSNEEAAKAERGQEAAEEV